ncbi:MAG: hypothetical protein PHP72_09745 [Dysgonamonadaceae bacterium]|jgi:hypothetical protein|nr:hypothetical protein [Dysgonamonadaceae bacterium]MDD4606649.1 hypothetical protein [Dysgonamonadaceae bacterium]HTN68711.1 hypothetical protein [Dysgonamonadaceae bacterium]
MKQEKQIELRSEKVRNIIGQIPPILITYGTLFIGLALLSLFLAAAFIPYQPTIDTEVTVYQLSNGELHFTAKIPQNEIEKKVQFVDISANSSIDLPMPALYKIEYISDTIYLAGTHSYYMATLRPINKVSETLKLSDTVTFPGKIKLQKKSVLKWILEKARR